MPRPEDFGLPTESKEEPFLPSLFPKDHHLLLQAKKVEVMPIHAEGSALLRRGTSAQIVEEDEDDEQNNSEYGSEPR